MGMTQGYCEWEGYENPHPPRKKLLKGYIDWYWLASQLKLDMGALVNTYDRPTKRAKKEEYDDDNGTSG